MNQPDSINARTVGFCIALIALWMLIYPYPGIFHDARLYTLLALNNLYPELYSNDLFVHFGSQDAFTVFTPIYAQTITWLGLEHAAALLAFFSFAGFIFGAWLWIKQLYPTPLALLSIGLLIVLPSHYGSGHFLHYLEAFLSPRMSAEALVLCALAADHARRHKTCLLLLLLSGSLHPLMAAAGVLFLLCKHFVIQRPKLSIAVTGMACLAGFAVLRLTELGQRLILDAEWRSIILDRAPYLSLHTWTGEDWGSVATTCSTLLIGWLTLSTQTERHCALAALLVGITGLGVSWIAGDLLHVTLIVQIQPWRWLWLASFCAVILMPAITKACWQQGQGTRPCLILLASTWLFQNESYALITGALSILSALSRSQSNTWPQRTQQLIHYGCCAVLCLASISTLANWLLAAQITDAKLSTQDNFDRATAFVRNGLLPALILMAFWLALLHKSHKLKTIITVFIGLSACMALTPRTLKNWTSVEFSEDLKQQFAPWRSLIPPGTDVYWPDNTIDTWLLLERPSYVSQLQTGVGLFSRNTALEIKRRALQLVTQTAFEPFEFRATNEIRPTSIWQSIPRSKSVPSLQDICSSNTARFIVTNTTLEASPVSVISTDTPGPYQGLKLYSC